MIKTTLAADNFRVMSEFILAYLEGKCTVFIEAEMYFGGARRHLKFESSNFYLETKPFVNLRPILMEGRWNSNFEFHSLEPTSN